ncbi:MAG: serine/threonine-protein phosphatase [Oscillospiraceae bacterium]|nr:serine/threonine-protein phosphatase [Oscillospiraceae bacterium]
MYYCCGLTDQGIGELNEDSYLVGGVVSDSGSTANSTTECDTDAPFIAAVADGVGGEDAGEIASRLTLQLLAGIRSCKREDIVPRILKIHEKVCAYGVRHGHDNMQSTLCALYVDSDDNAYAVNIGDSRLYLYREGNIRQITTDQSLVQMLYDQGRITDIERAKHEVRNIIFPVMGNLKTAPTPVITDMGVLGFGDVVLICSDGLSDYVTRGELEDVLARPMHLTKRLRLLADLALEHGSTDNITAVGVYFKK